MPTRLTVKLPDDFDLPVVVCSYGYYVLEPNLWDAGAAALHRPLRDTAGRLVQVRIRQRGRQLVIDADRALPPPDRAAIRQQAARMLRVDESLQPFHQLHQEAKRRLWGRLFRSPTLFEDIVRTITACNVTWANTKTMNRLLCEHIGGGGFPTPAQLAAVTPDHLKARCKVGYRADRIVRLARQVLDGSLDLTAMEDPLRPTDDVYRALREIHGIGDYAASNILHHLGRYDRLAIDSEAYRHFCAMSGIDRPKDPKSLDAAIRSHYEAYAPYPFLAYWYDLTHPRSG